MSLELVQYENELKQMVNTIHDVLGVEMIVVDRWLYTIINTFDYGDNPVDVKVNSVVGSIIVSGKPQLIRNRSESEACRICADYDRCEMEGVIGVPINYQGSCAGVIAVMVRKSNVSLFKDAQKIFDILTRFADIFVKSLEYDTANEAIQDIKRLITEPFDSIEEPVVFLGQDNVILKANQSFYDFFISRGQKIEGKIITEVLAQHRVKVGRDISVGELFVGNSSLTAQVDAIRTYTLDIWELEKIVYFKLKSPSVYLDRPRAYRAAEKMEKFWGPSIAMQFAKENAIQALNNPLPVLIQGPSISQNRELMKIISRYGPDVNNIPAIIECSMETEELYHLLFGDQIENPGHLWPSACPAICLASVDRMPLYIQKKMCDFVVQQRENPKVIHKLRIFATSNRNLTELVDRGLFLPEFLQILRQNYIIIPDIKDSFEDREYYLQMYLNEYAKIYYRDPITMDTDFLNAFLQDQYLTRLQYIHEAAEFFVMNCKEDQLNFACWCMWENRIIENEDTEDNLNLVQLKLLLDSGFSKKKIAEKMGISRATLYRWLKELEM